MKKMELFARHISLLFVIVLSSACGGDGDVALDSLSITNENLEQIFQPNQTNYTATVGFLAQSVTLKATTTLENATITVNGVTVSSNNTSHSIALSEGINPTITVVVTKGSNSKAYTLTITRETVSEFAEQAYIKGLNTNTADQFGYSVALSGDTLAVGAHVEASSATGINSTPDNFATEAGAVYIFSRSGSTWTQQAYIKASNTDALDHFGYSIALSGDTLAVGATDEDSSTTGINSTPDNFASDAGAVYVYSRSGSTWTQQAYIKASNTGVNYHFGHSVALSDNTLAVGAHTEFSSTTGINSTPDVLAQAAGAVYVYSRTGNTWSQQAYIKASNTGANDLFGKSVALSGDILAVGASQEDGSTTGINSTPDNLAPDAGAVYIYSRSGTSWSQEAYIKASNTDANDWFGWSVALSGNTLAVGAVFEDSSTTGINSTPNNIAESAGAVYVYKRSGMTWTQQAYIKASNIDRSNNFGWSVALSGDTLAVGARHEPSSTTGIDSTPNNLAASAGAAYLYGRNNKIWTQQAYIKASNTDADDRFGSSVALSGDTLAVGAIFEDSSTVGINSTPDNLAASAGAAYVFE